MQLDLGKHQVHVPLALVQLHAASRVLFRFLETPGRHFRSHRQPQGVAFVRSQFQRPLHRLGGLIDLADAQQVIAVQHARLARLRVLRLEPIHPLVGVAGPVEAIPQIQAKGT